MSTHCETIQNIYLQFFKKYPITVLLNVILELMLPLLEISLYRNIAVKIIDNLSTLKGEKVVSTVFKFRKFVIYLILLQFGHFVNQYLVNVLIPKYQEFVRGKIISNSIKTQNLDNIELTIKLNAMPLAFYQFYSSILKYILPLVVLFTYIFLSVFVIDKTISLITFLYCFSNIVSIFIMIYIFSKKASNLWNHHGQLVQKYNEIYSEKTERDIQNLQKEETEELKEKELLFEKKRQKLYAIMNFFIFYFMTLFFIFTAIIIYLLSIKKPSKLKTIIPLLFFSARFFNVILTRTTVTTNSFGKISILNENFKTNCVVSNP